MSARRPGTKALTSASEDRSALTMVQARPMAAICAFVEMFLESRYCQLTCSLSSV